jgi:hypothetical protein
MKFNLIECRYSFLTGVSFPLEETVIAVLDTANAAEEACDRANDLLAYRDDIGGVGFGYFWEEDDSYIDSCPDYTRAFADELPGADYWGY